MSSTLEYKGYSGSVEYSAEDRCLHGKIIGIRDLVSYEGRRVDDLEKNFRAAIDEYLAFCKAENKQPDQPFKGTFQVRLKGDLHRRLAIYAEQKHESLNAAANEAVAKFLEEVAQ
jgi:predicted HicB family RNase H-like nuclease